MAELSPAAQAVLDAVREYCPAMAEEVAAAAVRAIADQVVPKERKPWGVSDYQFHLWEQRRLTRRHLLFITAELEGQQ